MKTVQEYWDLTDKVAEAIRNDATFCMEKTHHNCGSPACIAGHVCSVVGVRAVSTGGPTMKLAGEILGVPWVGDRLGNVYHLFDGGLTGFDRDLAGRYYAGDRQEAAVEMLYRVMEKTHGPRPTPTYEVPDWRRVVRELQLEEAGCITQG